MKIVAVGVREDWGDCISVEAAKGLAFKGCCWGGKDAVMAPAWVPLALTLGLLLLLLLQQLFPLFSLTDQFLLLVVFDLEEIGEALVLGVGVHDALEGPLGDSLDPFEIVLGVVDMVGDV